MGWATSGDVEVGGVPEGAAHSLQGRRLAGTGQHYLDDAVGRQGREWLLELDHLPHLGMPLIQQREQFRQLRITRQHRVLGPAVVATTGPRPVQVHHRPRRQRRHLRTGVAPSQPGPGVSNGVALCPCTAITGNFPVISFCQVTRSFCLRRTLIIGPGNDPLYVHTAVGGSCECSLTTPVRMVISSC
jgi:hypothetical protein